MKAFFERVEQITTLSDEAKAALASIAMRHELPKGRTLIQSGSICDQVFFIEKGLARTFYIKDDKDVTDWLAAENDFVLSVISFLTRQPDRRAVELLEPSVLWSLPHAGLESLYRRFHEVERLGRLLVSFGLVLLQQRFDDLHFSTAGERYHQLLERYPSFVNRVPLGIIASYLGITQETLSRIRAKR